MQSGTVKLNNHLQSKGRLTALTWIEISKGPEHAPSWTCECKIDGKGYGIGDGPTKQIARSAAAEAALAKMQEDGDI